LPEDSSPQRGDRILDAAARLIEHYGYDKTTVSDIAAEAGVSKGAIYLHWKSKDELFEALLLRESARVLEEMIQHIEAHPDGGTIFALFQYGIISIVNNPLMHALATRDARVLGDWARRSANSPMMNEGGMFRRELVRQLQAANVIRSDLDGDVISYILALIRYGFLTIHEVYPADQTPPLEVVGKALAILLEKALAPEDGGDREAGRQIMINLTQQMRVFLQHWMGKTTGKPAQG
jgi:TetR/AcrR family acrAB operon transcriptional repressor